MKGSIKLRGSNWTYVVDVGIDPVTGKRKQKTKGGFKRKKDAQSALNKLLVEIDDNRYIDPSKETFSEFIDRWFTEHFQKRIGETTAVNKNSLKDKHLIKENPFAHKPLSKITTEDIDVFYNLKIDEGYRGSYIRKMHQLLKQAFEQAKKWEKISSNPVDNAEPPSIKKEEMKIWSPQEINVFLLYCTDERYRMIFLLAIYTGMRRGEILGLKWSDIDFEKKKITVKRSLAYTPKKGYIFTKLKTKNAKREILITDMLIDELLKHLKRQQTWKQRFEKEYRDQDFVICTEKGTEQDPRNVLVMMKRLISIANVTSIRFHDLRHTHASILISEGVDIVKVAHRLGHSNPKITLETYAHLVPNQDNDVADIFHSAINRSVSKL
ncbi:tyrosine-type recombinase/integrase [Lysinibacillus agricola]|uniref:site-specific integrase n=1 Tax=Lysinibacillus agricola TaxID=2590012 RepID=UPI003C1C83EF